MLDTQTDWDDSGFDCDHCGGQILKRTDREEARVVNACFQCEQCGCQWTLEGNVLRVGYGRHCKTAQQSRMNQKDEPLIPPIAIFITFGVIALFLVWRFGGMLALRYMLPVAIGIAVVVNVVKFGREREWW